MPRHRDLAPRARRTLLWSVLAFAALQVGLNFLMEDWRPALRDPEFGFKLSFLRRRLDEEPDRPLVLVLGGSRPGLGFRPDVARPRKALAFNFALTATGPVTELLCLRRLLGQGIRPDVVILEVFPLWLHQEKDRLEVKHHDINRVGWKDLAVLRRFTDDPQDLVWRWGHSRLAPCHTHRYSIMSWYAPDWLPNGSRQDGWSAMDSNGWLAYDRPRGSAEATCRAVEHTRQQYAGAIEGFRISETPDRALHELLDLCRQERITAALLVMPEGSKFQSWYAYAPRMAIDAYLTCLSQEYGVPLVDARDWLDDSYFFDSHHLYPEGSALFTRRLVRDVLQPLLRSRGERVGMRKEEP